VVRRVNRGEIWMYQFKVPNKRRPVLVLTRQHVIELLHWIMVAPISSSIHGIPSEVLVGVDEGLKHPSAINLDNVQSVERSRLTTFVGSLDPLKLNAVCRALAIAVGCAD
jgi:mRNA interferase MazF